ncbi:MAG: TonB-dependent receptor [Gammaproteobacteria bacterium]|nr:MAG: TonB-dependent receptor [Gammaproteobacteria bacterium]
MKKCLCALVYLVAVSGFCDEFSSSGSESDMDLMSLYGGEEFISIATGITQPIAKAPAVASVITRSDIEKIGARDIDEALETIPGLHVARDSTGYNPIYTFRGIYAAFNPQVLMLVNGIPITNLLNGDRNVVWGGMPVNAVERIEVIRGPGSALYGADAFAGVINVVTKSASGEESSELGARYGTYDTKDFWLSKGGSLGNIRYYGILEGVKTNGFDEVVDSDVQSILDGITGTNASLAPGSVNMQRENYDGRIELAYKHITFRAGLQSRNNAGDGVGAAQALSADNRFSSQRISSDLTFEDNNVADDLSVKVQVSYLQTSQEVEGDLILYPAGSTGPFLIGGMPIFFGGFPDGVIGTPEVYERHSRFNFSSFYKGLDKHEIGVGAGYYYGDLYKVKESKNYGINPYTMLPILPGDPVVDVSDTPLAFLTEDERENSYFFLQDVWQLANDWELTAGLRYDHYSDFGDTVNPRLALVWSTTRNLTTKFLYGEAFRAPSFAQTRALFNPLFQGNPGLDPEELKSYEIAFDYRAGYNLTLNLNAFYYEWEDIIQFVPDAGGSTSTARNAGEQTGHGLEFEARWQAARNLELIGNLAWQKSEDKNLNKDAGNAPEKQVYVQADWEFLPNWHMNVQTNWVMDRNRVGGDPRSDIDNYAIVDLTLRRKSVWDGVDVALIVKNLFDEDAREPSQNSDLGPLIYDDLPLAGQTVLGEVRYKF